MDNPAFLKDFGEQIEKSQPGVKQEPQPEKVYSFEEAVSLTGTGKFHYFLLLVSGLCFMVVLVETMGVSIILPFMKCDLKPTLAELGFLSSSGFLGIVLSSHAMGFLADTWGRVKTLRAALVFSFTTTVISAFSVNIWMLIVFRFLNGFLISGCQACVFSFLGELHGYKTRVRYVVLLSVFLPIGLMFLPGMAIGILPMKLEAIVLGLRFQSWRVLLLANSTLSLLALCGLLLTPESPKYVLIHGEPEQALRTLRKVFRLNTGRPENEYPVKQLHMEVSGSSLNNVHGIKEACKLVWSQTVPLFYKERVLHTINICCLMFVIYGISQGTFMWLPTMLQQMVAKSGQGYSICEIMSSAAPTNATVDATECGAHFDTGMFQILAIIGAVFTVTGVVCAYAIDFLGKKNLLLAWLFVSAVCCLAIHWANSFVLSVVLLTITLSINTCGGILSTMSVEYFPTNINAMAMCFIMMCARLGAVAGSNLVGLTIFTYCTGLLYAFLGLIGLVAFFSLFVPDKGQRKRSRCPSYDIKQTTDAGK